MVKKRAPKRKSLERVQTPASEKEKMKTLMNDLKSAVVNDLNLEAIKQILVDRHQRNVSSFLRSSGISKYALFFLWFSIDFNSSSFKQILFDFEQRYETINHDALIEGWDSMRTVLASVLNDHYKIVVHTVWMQEMHEILLLIRLFPLKSSGRNLGNIVSFVRAIEKLFVFKKVCICYCNLKNFLSSILIVDFFSQDDVPVNALIRKNNQHPYIIAVGASEKEIVRYYIDVEDHLFDVRRYIMII